MAMTRWFESAGWVVLGLAVIVATFAITVRPVGFDLFFYLEAARALVDGRSPYVPTSPACADLTCFPYLPPVALAFVPLLALPREVAVWGFVALLTGVAAALTAVLLAPLPRALRPWAAAMTATFFPLLLELNLANLDLLTAAFAVAAWSVRDRPARAGALLAIAIGMKLLAAPLLVFYAAAGRWRMIAWAAAWSALVALATAPWVAPYWREAVDVIAYRIRGEGGIRTGWLATLEGYVATTMLVLIVTIAAGRSARGRATDADGLHALALAACPFVASRIHYTYLVLELPLLAALAEAFAPRPLLLAMPAAAWLAIETPDPAWRAIGTLGAILLGAAVFVRWDRQP
jgi:hypothetical protein